MCMFADIYIYIGLNQNIPGFALDEFKLNHLKRIFISFSRLFKITEGLFSQEKMCYRQQNCIVRFLNKLENIIDQSIAK